MPSKVIDTVCGAISALLAMGVGTLVSSYEWTPERLLAAEAADREGPYVNSPLPGPIPEPTPTIIVGVGLTTEDIWRAEMERADVPVSKLAEYYGPDSGRVQFQPQSRIACQGQRGWRRACRVQLERNTPAPSLAVRVSPLMSLPAAPGFRPSYRERITSWLPPDARTPELEQAAYNWGIGSVRRAIATCNTLPGCNPMVWATIEPFVPAETKSYVAAIARHAENFQDTAP